MPDLPDNQAPQMSPQQLHPPPPPPLAPQFAGVPPAKPPSSSTKIVLIIVAVFVALGLIGACVVGVGVWYAAKSVHTTPSANFTENDLGIAIYPGATPSKVGMRMEIGRIHMLSAFYLTSDSTDQVIAFYKEKAGPAVRVITLANVTRIRAPAIGGDSVSIEVTPFADALGHKTRIKIDHVTQNAASN